MKFLLLAIFSLSIFQSAIAATATSIAIELESIKVEYIENTKRGIVYIYGCDDCSENFFTFEQFPKIKKNGKVITFETFMSEYWKAKHPAIFLDPKTKVVKKIIYTGDK